CVCCGAGARRAEGEAGITPVRPRPAMLTGPRWSRLLSSRAVTASVKGPPPAGRARAPRDGIARVLVWLRARLRSSTVRALAASVIVHGAAVLWFWGAKPPQGLRSDADEVSIEIVEVAPAPEREAAGRATAEVLEAEAVEPRARAADSDRSAPVSGAGPLRSRVASDEAGKTTGTSAPPVSRAPELAPRSETQPGGGVAAAPETSGGLSLRDLPPGAHDPALAEPTGTSGGGLPLPTRDLLARAGVGLEAPAGMELPDDRVGKRRKGPSRWQQGMDRLARIEAARASLRSRGAPPETHELWRDIERIFAPSHELVAELAKAEAGRAGSLSRWFGRYLGGFFGSDPTEAGRPFAPDAAFNRAVKAGALNYHARMCVHDGPNGEPVVESEGGSGVAKLDELARKTVIEAAQRRAPGTGGGVRACFQFTARLSRVPPLPIIACGFGKGWKPECAYPLKEVVATQVKLDGIEPGPQASAAPPDAGR
ncbi:MAG TPA: hypothetical protein VGF45_20965, partial [Polyangia bacterium]